MESLEVQTQPVFPECRLGKFITFSYLSGFVLFTKIALLDKATRASLLTSKLLDQQKVITFRDDLIEKFDT